MAGRGRPSKPLESKKRIGTLRQDRLPANAARTPVEALDLSGWELPPDAALSRVLSAGVPWLAATDNPKVALLNDAFDLYSRVKAAVDNPPRRCSDDDCDCGRPLAVRDLLDIMKEVRILLAELGFDPTARAKLGLAEVKAQSTLENLRASRQAKVSNPDNAV